MAWRRVTGSGSAHRGPGSASSAARTAGCTRTESAVVTGHPPGTSDCRDVTRTG